MSIASWARDDLPFADEIIERRVVDLARNLRQHLVFEAEADTQRGRVPGEPAIVVAGAEAEADTGGREGEARDEHAVDRPPKGSAVVGPGMPKWPGTSADQPGKRVACMVVRATMAGTSTVQPSASSSSISVAVGASPALAK